MRTAVSARSGILGLARGALLAGLCNAALACSPPQPEPADLRVRDGDPEGPVFYETGRSTTSNALEASGSMEPMFVDSAPPPPPGSIEIDDACVFGRAEATLIREPVDIIVLLDNSGSMADEAAAVEANINVNFANVLTSSEVDYRVIMITRHRTAPRKPGDGDSEQANTSVCVQAPLSGLSSCESAKEPVFSERFRQYSTKIESADSFDIAIDTYIAPFDDDDREEKYDHAPDGWHAWLRPGTKKVFLEVTDDDEDMPVADFVTELQRLAPEHFGSDPAHPAFVFHSIVGLAEKPTPTDPYLADDPPVSAKCSGNCTREDATSCVTKPGETYQELSRLTGGLRFPLCQFDAYDVVFRRIADDVVTQRDVACDFAIPAPPSLRQEVNLDNIAISYTSGTQGYTAQLGQAATPDDCASNAFYVNEAGDRLNLCPEACAMVRSDPLAAVTVLFTCKSQIIVH